MNKSKYYIIMNLCKHKIIMVVIMFIRKFGILFMQILGNAY